MCWGSWVVVDVGFGSISQHANLGLILFQMNGLAQWLSDYDGRDLSTIDSN